MAVKIKLILMVNKFSRGIGTDYKSGPLCLVLIILYCVGCSKKDVYDDLLSDVINRYSTISKYDWQILSAWTDGTMMLVEAQAVQGDTIISLSVLKFERDSTAEQDTIIVDLFEMNYPVNEFRYMDAFDLSGRLLYQYRYKADDPLKFPEFIVGKYRFLFESTGMPADQITYYLEHQDSLDRIEGDDLPELPSDKPNSIE